MCRVTIDFEEIGRNSIAEHIINELEVLCPNDDCPWRVT